MLAVLWCFSFMRLRSTTGGEMGTRRRDAPGWQVLGHGDGEMSSSTIGTGRRDKVMRPRELLEAPILL
jgi:hypothetical protein